MIKYCAANKNLWTKIIFANGRWAILFCLFYAACLLAFITGPGDGGWILYSHAILKGTRLYTDLHVNQQPLFPLFSTAIVLVAGDVIVTQKLAYFLVPAIYISLIYLIVCYVTKDGLKKGGLLIGIFFIAITFEAYRFDDYHPFAGVLILASLFLSIKLLHVEISLNRYVVFQSIIIALLLNTRLNDGVFLAAAVLCFGILTVGFGKKIILGLASSLLCFAMILTISLFILNDTYESWYVNSILIAAQVKGGDALLLYPFLMLKNASFFLIEGIFSFKRVVFILLALSVFYISLSRTSGSLKYVFLGVSFLGIAYATFKIYPHYALTLAAALGVIIAFIGMLIVLSIKILSSFNKSISYSRASPLIIYPFFLFIGGSLSSAGSFGDHFFPLAILILVLALILTNNFTKTPFRRFCKYFSFFTFALLACEAIALRTLEPYSWHSYQVPPFYEKRILINNSPHGPHLLSKDLAGLILPVCAEVQKSTELLSIPFSFANYYCKKEPWRGYIQTFFDTSSANQVLQLIQDINSNPPAYIFYQRQLENIAVHERLFNGGKPLPHRELDELIMNNIESKKWRIIYVSELYPPSVWFLIKTK